MNTKAKVEAVLFLTDKPLKAQAIARIVSADVQVVRQLLLELIADYEQRNGALEIAQDNGYIIEVKPEYSSLMEEFFPIEMSAALLRTLSAIAIKQPVAQSEIVRIRGAGAYDHIRDLLQKELIHKKEADSGRSPQLSTSKRFQEYFRLTNDGQTLRKHLRQQTKSTSAPSEQQLALPLTTEEQEKAQQVQSVLEQLMQVADAMSDGQPPEASPAEDSAPAEENR